MNKYFLTVNWCNRSQRGIFCDTKGKGFSKDSPHSKEEMSDILGIFSIVLNPKSEKFTEEEVKQFSMFRPLTEYRNYYGVALRKS